MRIAILILALLVSGCASSPKDGQQRANLLLPTGLDAGMTRSTLHLGVSAEAAAVDPSWMRYADEDGNGPALLYSGKAFYLAADPGTSTKLELPIATSLQQTLTLLEPAGAGLYEAQAVLANDSEYAGPVGPVTPLQAPWLTQTAPQTLPAGTTTLAFAQRTIRLHAEASVTGGRARVTIRLPDGIAQRSTAFDPHAEPEMVPLVSSGHAEAQVTPATSQILVKSRDKAWLGAISGGEKAAHIILPDQSGVSCQCQSLALICKSELPLPVFISTPTRGEQVLVGFSSLTIISEECR